MIYMTCIAFSNRDFVEGTFHCQAPLRAGDVICIAGQDLVVKRVTYRVGTGNDSDAHIEFDEIDYAPDMEWIKEIVDDMIACDWQCGELTGNKPAVEEAPPPRTSRTSELFLDLKSRGLSTRAAKVLARLNVNTLDELKHAILMSHTLENIGDYSARIQQCGKATERELLEWMERQPGKCVTSST